MLPACWADVSTLGRRIHWPSQQPYEAGSVIIPSLQTRKGRHTVPYPKVEPGLSPQEPDSRTHALNLCVVS